MFCIHCGSDIPATSDFCSGCGRPARGGRPGSALSVAAGDAGGPVAGVGSIAPNAPVYAGFWMRFLAMIIDSFVLMPLALLLIVPFALFLPAGREGAIPPEVAGVFSGIVLIIALLLAAAGWLYYTLMESSRHQATLGKKLLGLAVTDMNGRRISFGRANGRFFGKYLSGLIFNIGYIMAGFTEKKQALHDMIASCLVVRR